MLGTELIVTLTIFGLLLVAIGLRRLRSPTARLLEESDRTRPAYPAEPPEIAVAAVPEKTPVPITEQAIRLAEAPAAETAESVTEPAPAHPVISGLFRQGAYNALGRAVVVRASPYYTLTRVSVARRVSPKGKEGIVFRTDTRKVQSAYALHDELVWILAADLAETIAIPDVRLLDNEDAYERARKLIELITRSPAAPTFPAHWDASPGQTLPIACARFIFHDRAATKAENYLLHRAHAHARDILLPRLHAFDAIVELLAEKGAIDAKELDAYLGDETLAAADATPLP